MITSEDIEIFRKFSDFRVANGRFPSYRELGAPKGDGGLGLSLTQVNRIDSDPESLISLGLLRMSGLRAVKGSDGVKYKARLYELTEEAYKNYLSPEERIEKLT